MILLLLIVFIYVCVYDECSVRGADAVRLAPDPTEHRERVERGRQPGGAAAATTLRYGRRRGGDGGGGSSAR